MHYLLVCSVAFTLLVLFSIELRYKSARYFNFFIIMRIIWSPLINWPSLIIFLLACYTTEMKEEFCLSKSFYMTSDISPFTLSLLMLFWSIICIASDLNYITFSIFGSVVIVSKPCASLKPLKDTPAGILHSSKVINISSIKNTLSSVSLPFVTPVGYSSI